jgi:hypothetical protein
MAGLALGLPTVTTAGDATEPVWRDERLVELASVGDRESLLRRTEALLDQPELRADLGRRARLGYDTHFSSQRTITTLRTHL